MAGEVYLIFGSNGLSATQANISLSTLNGINGIIYEGIVSGSGTDKSLAAAGDVNNDGFDDFIMGTERVQIGGTNFIGEAYLIFGSSQPEHSNGVFNLNDIDGTNGLVFRGTNFGHFLGSSVSGGDLNADGVADIAVGARGLNSFGDVGTVYVIYGDPVGI